MVNTDTVPKLRLPPPVWFKVRAWGSGLVPASGPAAGGLVRPSWPARGREVEEKRLVEGMENHEFSSGHQIAEADPVKEGWLPAPLAGGGRRQEAWSGETRSIPAEGAAMTVSPSTESTLLRRLDRAGWPRVMDRVVRGICHDLNGRAYSLSSIGFLLSSGDESWPKLGAMMEEELRRLERTVRLLRRLPGDGSGWGLFAPGEVLPVVASLARLQPGLEGIEFEVNVPRDAPAFQAEETILNRTLLLLATGAAEEASLGPEKRVRILGPEEDGTLWITPARGERTLQGEGLPPDLRGPLPREMEGAVTAAFEGMGGGLGVATKPDGVRGYEVRFPSPGD